MNEKPKVSVIIPSYNAKERLEGSLFSLTLQETDIPFEVIVADNGSTDGTMEMLENIEVNFPFKKVRIPVNQGIAKGRNHAIREAEGDLLIFHDSDMLAEPRFIQKHAEAMLAGRISSFAVCAGSGFIVIFTQHLIKII
nr:glycosyltransferase family A protein [Bacillus safensis]